MRAHQAYALLLSCLLALFIAVRQPQAAFHGSVPLCPKGTSVLDGCNSAGSSTLSTISGTTLTLGGTVTGLWGPGELLTGAGVTAYSYILEVISGTPGTVGSTYLLSESSTISSGETITASAVAPPAGAPQTDAIGTFSPTLQYPNFWNPACSSQTPSSPTDGCAIQTNQTYDATALNLLETQQNWAGVDYPVGPNMTAIGKSFKDVSVAALPAGCAFSTSTGHLTCTNAGPLILSGFNLRYAANAGNSPIYGVWVDIGSLVTQVVFQNNAMLWGANDSLSNMWTYSGTGHVYFLNNEVDCAGAAWNNSSASEAVNTPGQLVALYNAMSHCPRFFGANTPIILDYFNYKQGMGYATLDPHAEQILDTALSGSFDYLEGFGIFLQPYLTSGGSGWNSATSAYEEHVTAATFYGKISDGAGHAGNILSVDSNLSGTLIANTRLLTGTGVTIGSIIQPFGTGGTTGTGGLGTYQLSQSSNIQSDEAMSSGSSTATIGLFQLDHVAHLINGSSSNCANGGTPGQSCGFGSAGLILSYVIPTTNMNILSSFLDPTGAQGGYCWEANGAYNINPPTFSGNYDLIGGGAINAYSVQTVNNGICR
jgi:hypothetical protein